MLPDSRLVPMLFTVSVTVREPEPRLGALGVTGAETEGAEGAEGVV